MNASPPLTAGSLFSGVGGMDIGLEWAGFQHQFFAEIDPYCRAVLAARFPGVPVYEDVRHVANPHAPGEQLPDGACDWERASRIDLLCGGFPCQDLSVAGKRAGLAGERSGLFFEFMRIVDALRPRAILIENVEGLYSSGSPKGADFGVVLDSLAERGYLASWRTLDAQHFGVPQRRRRVFVCAIADGDPGAERIGEVLAVAEGSGGDSSTSDPSWPLTAAAAGRGAEGSGGRIVGALSAAAYVKYTDQEFVRQGQLVTGEDLIRTGKNAEVIKRTGDDTYYIEDVERGPVKAGGAGGGPPRSDRLPLITYRKSRRAQSVEDAESRVDDGIANTLNQFDTGDTRTTHAVVSVGGDIAHTLTKEGHDAGEDRTGRGTPVVSFYSTGGSHNGFARTDGLSPTLKVGSGLGIPSPPAVAFSHYSSDPGPGAVSPTMRSGTNVSGHAVQYGPTVRRLTPMECERLMAFPDGWTDVPWNKKDHSPDSRRYAACGNGVVSTVAWWIGARLAEVLRES